MHRVMTDVILTTNAQISKSAALNPDVEICVVIVNKVDSHKKYILFIFYTKCMKIIFVKNKTTKSVIIAVATVKQSAIINY